MSFSIKDWKDSPNTTTPISAAALEDMETRLSDYTDSAVADLASGQLPWTIDIVPFATPATQTNWSDLNIDSTQAMNARLRSSGAQNAEIGWDVVMGAGTWTFAMLTQTATDSGITTVTLDGDAFGTVDCYSDPFVGNVVKTITGVTVATSGKKRLLLKQATKNAGSSSYFGRISLIRLLRTA